MKKNIKFLILALIFLCLNLYSKSILAQDNVVLLLEGMYSDSKTGAIVEVKKDSYPLHSNDFIYCPLNCFISKNNKIYFIERGYFGKLKNLVPFIGYSKLKEQEFLSRADGGNSGEIKDKSDTASVEPPAEKTEDKPTEQDPSLVNQNSKNDIVKATQIIKSNYSEGTVIFYSKSDKFLFSIDMVLDNPSSLKIIRNNKDTVIDLEFKAQQPISLNLPLKSDSGGSYSWNLKANGVLVNGTFEIKLSDPTLIKKAITDGRPIEILK